MVIHLWHKRKLAPDRATLRVPHLHGNHLHKDGEVCQMVTQANREGQVSISSHTPLIGPHTLFGAETHTYIQV